MEPKLAAGLAEAVFAQAEGAQLGPEGVVAAHSVEVEPWVAA